MHITHGICFSIWCGQSVISYQTFYIIKEVHYGQDCKLSMLMIPIQVCELTINLSGLPPGPRFAWWRHQMETFSALLTICAGNSTVPVNSPHKSQWRGALMFSLICVWINGWVNNREAGDLRRYRAHCDVTVMDIKTLQALWFLL